MSITDPNLGPLTTAYSASGVNCDSLYETNNGALIHGTITDSVSFCQPSGFVPWGGYYYSPGVCPSGNTYACFALLGDGGTAATCCPTGYQCRIGRSPTDGHACDSRIMTDTSVTVSRYISTDEGTLSTKVTDFFTKGQFVFAQGVVVRRGNNDPTWPILTTDLTTSTASDQSSNSPTSIGLGNDSANTSLTTSAKIGIGVGVPLGVLLIIGVAITACLIGKRKRWPAHEPINQNYSTTREEYQSHGRQVPWDNMGRHKGVLPVELEGRSSPAELTG